MAEVRVSVDGEGATQGFGTASASAGGRDAISAAEVPPAPDASLPPLPGMDPRGGGERRAAPATRPIGPEEWVQDDNYWDTQSLIAVSGRMAVPRPKPRPLDPPQRFRPVRRWQSMAALIVVSVVILAACVGMLRAAGLANNLLHPHQPVPTITTHPTGSPTVPLSPTAKPRK